MCGSNWASYIPPTRHFTFLSLLLVKSRPTGGKTLNVEVKYSSYIKYGTFHFEYRGEIFLVYLRREMKSRGAPQGVCTTLNSNHTLFWRSSEWGVELFLLHAQIRPFCSRTMNLPKKIYWTAFCQLHTMLRMARLFPGDLTSPVNMCHCIPKVVSRVRTRERNAHCLYRFWLL